MNRLRRETFTNSNRFATHRTPHPLGRFIGGARSRRNAWAGRPTPGAMTVASCLPTTSECTALARRLVRRTCHAWGLPQLTDDAELAVTELVANAVRHVGGAMELLVTLDGAGVEVALRDDSPVRPIRATPDPRTGQGGRGLLLLDAVAATWGSQPAGTGKVVWVRIHPPATGR